MRVLLVDDDDALRSLVEGVLAEHGHEPVCVATGERAWAQFEAQRFPLLVVDWVLPGIDGLELCRRVRATSEGDRPVILVMTGRDGADDLSRVLAAGANDYICKPFDVTQFEVRLAVAESHVAETDERKRIEAALEHQALHDALTGLPNRALLNDRLRHAIAAAYRSRSPLALLMLDLDLFKEVNDTFGHVMGDRVLQQIASRLEGASRQSDTVARLGGDEFAILLPNTDSVGATVAAGKLLSAIETPMRIDDREHDLRGSIGVAVCPQHGEDADTLLRHADAAMYLAKHAHSRLAVYSADEDLAGGQTPRSSTGCGSMRSVTRASASPYSSRYSSPHLR